MYCVLTLTQSLLNGIQKTSVLGMNSPVRKLPNVSCICPAAFKMNLNTASLINPCGLYTPPTCSIYVNLPNELFSNKMVLVQQFHSAQCCGRNSPPILSSKSQGSVCVNICNTRPMFRAYFMDGAYFISLSQAALCALATTLLRRQQFQHDR